MPPRSLLLHSRSFRPLRNTFRSIDFAVDTQAVGTERRRSRKSARVKGGETGARLARGRGRRREGEHIGRKGKKRNATAETRSRNKRVARVERGTEQKRERRTGERKGWDRDREREKGRKRTNEREEEKEMSETGSARDREATRETAFNYPPTYGGEERLVCSGLHHPREPTPGPPTASLFPAFLPSPPFSSPCLSSHPSSSFQHIKHIFPGRPSVVSLFLHDGKTNSPGGRWWIPPSSRPRSRSALNITN